MRTSRTLCRAAIVLGVAVAVVALACLIIDRSIGDSAPEGFGNRAPATPERKHLRIAVFGDSQKGFGSFRALLDQAARERVDLAVHTGDLVSRADQGHYRLAIACIRRSDLRVPFLVAPGNHDLKPDPELFERRVGPREIATRWDGVNLVLIDNALGPPDLARVEALLKPCEGPILLFCHVPPWEPAEPEFSARPGFEPLLELLSRYPVRYVFSGHAHTYRRIERRGIVYIANGVGGDYESWQLGQKAYATLVDVLPDRIADRPIVAQPVHSLWANVEHLALGHVVPSVGGPAGLAALFVLGTAGALAAARALRRGKTREPSGPPPVQVS